MAKKNKDKNKDLDDVEKEMYSEDIVLEDIDIEGGHIKNIKKAKEKLKICLEEKKEYLDGWQRAKADLINLRKDEEEERKRASKFSNESLVMEFLSVVDSFDMAFANKESWDSVDETWRKGIEYIYTQFISTLEQNGVSVINPEGEEFDPQNHTSVDITETDDESKNDKISEVMQKGYVLNGKTIKPAQVKVFSFKK